MNEMVGKLSNLFFLCHYSLALGPIDFSKAEHIWKDPKPSEHLLLRLNRYL